MGCSGFSTYLLPSGEKRRREDREVGDGTATMPERGYANVPAGLLIMERANHAPWRDRASDLILQRDERAERSGEGRGVER
jgi:hypothetical protein